MDEATSISVDYSLLDIAAIKAEIEKQPEIGSRQGMEIKSAEGDGDEIEIGEEFAIGDKTKEDRTIDDSTQTEVEKDYRKKFAMYYARILFFAFLTDSKVKSLNEILTCLDSNKTNLRITANLDLNKKNLSLFESHINPFILSELDYKIHNINSLANDSSLEPVERAKNALKKSSYFC